MSMIGHNNQPLNGYILVSRAMISHKIVGAGHPVKPHKPSLPTYSRFEAWQDLIMMASYQDRDVKIAGKKYELRMGEAVCARAYLAARWNWSEKTVRVFIERLIKHGMAMKEREKKGQNANRLSICNYSQYQRPSTEEGQDRGQQKGQQKGQQNDELSRCKQTINMFEDDKAGPPKGPIEGPQYKEIITKNKKDICPSAKQDLEIAVSEYNDLASRSPIPKIMGLSDKRKKLLSARLKEHGLEGWRKVLYAVEGSSFLCGENDRKWRADFDWLVNPNKFLKVLEGGYGNGRIRKTNPTEKQKQIFARLKEIERQNTEVVL